MTRNKSLERLMTSAKSQDGMALLIAVIVLLLMSALGLAALQHAGDEASDSGRARRKDSTLYAADSGIKIVQIKLLGMINDPTMADVNLDEPTLITDGYGNAIPIRSGAPNAGMFPAAAEAIGPDSSKPPQPGEGDKLGGGAGSFYYSPVRVDVTAEDVANGMVHLQAQFKLFEGSGNSYGG